MQTKTKPAYYMLKRPGKEKGRRAKSFLLLYVSFNEHGKAQYRKHAHPELNEINRAFQKGIHDYAYSDKRATQLRDDLNAQLREPKNPLIVPSLPENEALRERYWNEVYKTRPLADTDSEMNGQKRAIRALGNTPLLTENVLSIELALSEYVKKQAERKGRHFDERMFNKLLSKVRQLRKYYGKATILKQKRKPPLETKSLTLAEFEQVLKHIKDKDFRLLCKIGFGTGCRIGEIFAITEESLKEADGSKLYIEWQYRRNWEFVPPKNKRSRELPVFHDAMDAVLEWIDLSDERKREINEQWRYNAADALKDACKKAFPQVPRKWLTFHQLRHCYARRILNIPKMTLQDVADYIGDDLNTTREHYTRWKGSDTAMEHALAYMKKTKKAA